MKVCGTGVVDTGCYENFGVASAAKGARSLSNVALFSCRDVTVDGPVLVDAAARPVTTAGCERVTFVNIKELGQWRSGAALGVKSAFASFTPELEGCVSGVKSAFASFTPDLGCLSRPNMR